MAHNEKDLPAPARDESPESFRARLRMLEDVGHILKSLPSDDFTVAVENERTNGDRSGLESDYVLEFGDLRLRLILTPLESAPWLNQALLRSAQIYLLEASDTDALVIVGNDNEATAVIVDPYSARHEINDIDSTARPLRAAISEYFARNALAIEIPDFRSVVALPSLEDLRQRLRTVLTETFDTVADARAIIPQKKSALEALTRDDLERLISGASRALEREAPSIDTLLSRDNSEEQ